MKKLAKILIVVMSLALIVGALAVVISAEDTPAQPNTVEYTVNGEVLSSDGNFDNAIAAVKGNQTADANITIKLLGDCTASAIDFSGVTVNATLTIDLNGYVLDLSGAGTAFTVGACVDTTVTGTGTVNFKTEFLKAVNPKDKNPIIFNVTGTDVNNKISVKSTSECTSFANLANYGDTRATFTNADINISFSRTITSTATNPSGQLFRFHANAQAKLIDCNFTYDVAFGLDGSGNYNKDTGFSVYLAKLEHASMFILTNTVVKTAGSGIHFNDARGMEMTYNGKKDRYSFVMENSTLRCLNDNPTTQQSLKTMGELVNQDKRPLTSCAINRNVLFHSNGTLSIGDVYIKNSYTSGNFRMVYGSGTNHSASNTFQVTYDNSTMEWFDNSLLIGGVTGGNGDGLFSAGGTYMNFINGSVFDMNGMGLTCGGSENSSIANRILGNVHGVVEDGKYVLDLGEGTRLDVSSISNVDIPKGAKIIHDPEGNAKYPYVVTAKYVTTTWYYGSNTALSSTKVETVAGRTSTFNAATVTISGIMVNGNVFSGKGWIANEWINPADYANGDDYVAAIAGKEVITNFDGYVINDNISFYPVYEYAGALGFTVTTKGGVVSYYTVNDDLNRAMGGGLDGSTVKLYADYTITDKYRSYKDGDTSNASKDEYLRNVRYFDLNGNTLNIESSIWIDVCEGKFYLYSSQAGGKLTQYRQNNNEAVGSTPVFQVRSWNALLNVGAYGDNPASNVTVIANSLAVVKAWGKGSVREPKVKLDGGTYINVGTYNFVQGASINNNSKVFTAENATFINAAAGNIYNGSNKNTADITNCDFIDTGAGNKFIEITSTEAVVNIYNCRFGGVVNPIKGTVNIYGGTVAAGYEGTATLNIADGFVAAYTNYKMPMPGLLKDSYVVTYETADKTVVTLDPITAETLPTLNYIIAAEGDTETHTWNNPGGEAVTSVVAVKGVNLDSFIAQANNALKDYKKNLNVLYLVHDGNWTTEGTTYTATVKVGGVVKGAFLASVGMTVHKNFDINFMVDANSYKYLADETKALFTQVGEYYIVTESVARAVNQAFTKANYDLVIVDGDYTYTAHYEASIVDYVAKNFAEGSVATAENKAMAYYIAAYLNSAYAHFTTTDEPSADALAALAEIVNTQSKNYTTGLNPKVEKGNYDKIKNKGVEIAIDLKSTPKYVITSATYAGTVTFNGVTKSFAAGEEVVLSASVLNFDNMLTITLQDADNSTGTYSLANYVENSLGNDSYTEELKALIVAFSDYVIYAENFRAK